MKPPICQDSNNRKAICLQEEHCGRRAPSPDIAILCVTAMAKKTTNNYCQQGTRTTFVTAGTVEAQPAAALQSANTSQDFGSEIASSEGWGKTQVMEVSLDPWGLKTHPFRERQKGGAREKPHQSAHQTGNLPCCQVPSLEEVDKSRAVLTPGRTMGQSYPKNPMESHLSGAGEGPR